MNHNRCTKLDLGRKIRTAVTRSTVSRSMAVCISFRCRISRRSFMFCFVFFFCSCDMPFSFVYPHLKCLILISKFVLFSQCSNHSNNLILYLIFFHSFDGYSRQTDRQTVESCPGLLPVPSLSLTQASAVID